MSTEPYDPFAARDEAILRVAASSSPDQPFYRTALIRVACQREAFVADDVWRALGGSPAADYFEAVREPRALGATLLWAARAGWIEQDGYEDETGDLPSGRRRHAGRPQRRWRSRITGQRLPPWPARPDAPGTRLLSLWGDE